jgi:hypothetical protein
VGVAEVFWARCGFLGLPHKSVARRFRANVQNAIGQLDIGFPVEQSKFTLGACNAYEFEYSYRDGAVKRFVTGFFFGFFRVQGLTYRGSPGTRSCAAS